MFPLSRTGILDPTDVIDIMQRKASQGKTKLKSTPVEVLFWNAKNTQIGHVALYLPDNYLYVSFWPDETVSGSNAMASVRSTTHCYDEDKEAEGRGEDEIFKANFDLDVSAMEKRWNEIKTWKYSLLEFNCTDVVLRVLAAGNSEFDTDFTDVLGRPKMGSLLVSFMDKNLGQVRELGGRITWFKTNGVFSAVTSYTNGDKTLKVKFLNE